MASDGLQESFDNLLRVIVGDVGVGPKASRRDDPSHAVAVRGAECEFDSVGNEIEVCLRLRRFLMVENGLDVGSWRSTCHEKWDIKVRLSCSIRCSTSKFMEALVFCGTSRTEVYDMWDGTYNRV